MIGGGAVGLAIARRLAQRKGSSTVLVERNEAVGMETSSRNSEVGFLLTCVGGEFEAFEGGFDGNGQEE